MSYTLIALVFFFFFLPLPRKTFYAFVSDFKDSPALIFDQNRAVFWPRSFSNLEHFFTTRHKEINRKQFVFSFFFFDLLAGRARVALLGKIFLNLDRFTTF